MSDLADFLADMIRRALRPGSVAKRMSILVRDKAAGVVATLFT